MFSLSRAKNSLVYSLQAFLKIFIFLWGISFVFSLASADQVWKDLSSKKDQFSVSMPGEAKFQSENIKTALGPIEAHEWTVDTEAGAGFVTMTNQYPAAHIAKVGPTRLLEGAQKGGLGSEGKLKSQKEINVEGYPGREIVMAKAKDVFFIRLLLVKTRLYQMIVVIEASKESLITPDVEKFFNSFKLLK